MKANKKANRPWKKISIIVVAIISIFALGYISGIKDTFKFKDRFAYTKKVLQKDVPPSIIRYFSGHGGLQNLESSKDIEIFNTYLKHELGESSDSVFLTSFRLTDIDGPEVEYEFRKYWSEKCLRGVPAGLYRGSLAGIDKKMLTRITFYESDTCIYQSEIPLAWKTSPFVLDRQTKEKYNGQVVSIESLEDDNGKLLWKVTAYGNLNKVIYSELIDDETGNLY